MAHLAEDAHQSQTAANKKQVQDKHYETHNHFWAKDKITGMGSEEMEPERWCLDGWCRFDPVCLGPAAYPSHVIFPHTWGPNKTLDHKNKQHI